MKIDNDRVPALGLGTWNLNGNKCIETVSETIGVLIFSVTVFLMHSRDGC